MTPWTPYCGVPDGKPVQTQTDIADGLVTLLFGLEFSALSSREDKEDLQQSAMCHNDRLALRYAKYHQRSVSLYCITSVKCRVSCLPQGQGRRCLCRSPATGGQPSRGAHDSTCAGAGDGEKKAVVSKDHRLRGVRALGARCNWSELERRAMTGWLARRRSRRRRSQSTGR
jgi:hypothetical protein